MQVFEGVRISLQGTTQSRFFITQSSELTHGGFAILKLGRYIYMVLESKGCLLSVSKP